MQHVQHNRQTAVPCNEINQEIARRCNTTGTRPSTPLMCKSPERMSAGHRHHRHKIQCTIKGINGPTQKNKGTRKTTAAAAHINNARDFERKTSALARECNTSIHKNKHQENRKHARNAQHNSAKLGTTTNTTTATRTTIKHDTCYVAMVFLNLSTHMAEHAWYQFMTRPLMKPNSCLEHLNVLLKHRRAPAGVVDANTGSTVGGQYPPHLTATFKTSKEQALR